MKYIYAVHDLAVDAYGMPFFLNSKGEAMRSFTDEVNSSNANSAIAKHPEDYVLFELGEYDEKSGTITPHEKPLLLAHAKNLFWKEK